MRRQPPLEPPDANGLPGPGPELCAADWVARPVEAEAAGGASLPVLPVRDVVVFPSTVIPLIFGRERSLRALRRARSEDAMALLVAQRDPEHDDPAPEDLYQVGTVARCLQSLELPDGTVRVVVEGMTRVRIVEMLQTDPFMVAAVEPVSEVRPDPSPHTEAIKRRTLDEFEEATELSRRIPPEALVTALNIDDLGQLADIITSCLDLDLGHRQALLEESDCARRLQTVARYLLEELRVLRLEEEMRARVEDEIDSSQREYYLREHLRAIQDELGQVEGVMGEAWEYRERIEAAELPQRAREAAVEQVARLERMPMASPEVSVIRTYLDWILELPWAGGTDDRLDVERAQRILDQDHYGLTKAKERILELLAVRQLVEEAKGPILCFVGPPGVGKTSIGQSIARAMGREFVRISLGGVRDEAEIRGHRRTYVGALPGRIIQALRRVGSRNPVFMIDEVDKIGADFRGDPSSALLEVLDPEQNHAFSDHYLEVPFDLSRVLFIATGNILDTVPPALRDRMEVIEFPGYIEEEKLQIARDYLVPKQREAHGLTGQHLRFHQSGLRSLIRHYTREAGVRNLEREIASICRKVARDVAAGSDETAQVTAQFVEDALGPARHTWNGVRGEPAVGVATGLSYTDAGGDVTSIEVSVVEGDGELLLTGQLGEVMRESAQAALSYVRGRTDRLGLPAKHFSRHDIHVHVPAGAVPKEGPSAGVTICTALVSALTGRPVRSEVALTGEISLHGSVLPVGGVREKVLAAHRAGIRTVVLPEDNERDMANGEQFPDEVFEDLEFVYVSDMQQVLECALADSDS
ncbi:MAG: endopeptidase La [Armatimonadota bacterium]|nr:endopeptidase La [Armatimonadota bacterium]